MNDLIKKRFSSPIHEHFVEDDSSILDLDTISIFNSFTSSKSPISLYKYVTPRVDTKPQMQFCNIKLFKKLIVFSLIISVLTLLLRNFYSNTSHKISKKLYLKDYMHMFQNESAKPRFNFEIYDEFDRIRKASSQIDLKRVHYYCSYNDNDKLTGIIDVEQVLNELNLTNLVKFYKSNSTLNESEDSASQFNYLGNSTDINLLNTSVQLESSSNLIDYENIKLGGHWKPKDCLSTHKIAIIIPFRDRLPHLKVITNYLHMFLQRQSLDYRIFVVEPTIPLNISFNKGRVMNSAYLEVLKVDPKIDCIIFHDVDLVPEDDRNIYSCSFQPRHLSVAIDKFDYILPYNYLVGGVLSIRTDQYKLTNGYSNMYWGWGGEDDDYSQRIKRANLDLHRPPSKVARYKMMKHKPQKLNQDRFKLLRRPSKAQNNDGLNTVNYKIVDFQYFNLFTYILIDVGNP